MWKEQALILRNAAPRPTKNVAPHKATEKTQMMMMKKKLSAVLATVVLGLTLSHAQQPRDPSGPAPVSQTQGANTNHDWGWIGLLGLVGLAGLMGRKRDTTTRMNNKCDDRSENARKLA